MTATVTAETDGWLVRTTGRNQAAQAEYIQALGSWCDRKGWTTSHGV